MSIYTGQTRRGTPESEGCWRDPVTGRRGRPCVEGVEAEGRVDIPHL